MIFGHEAADLVEDVVLAVHALPVQGKAAALLVRDRTHVLTRAGDVQVGVDQARNDRPALQVDLDRVRAGQLQHGIVGTHCRNLVSRNGDRLGGRKTDIHRQDLSVVQDQVGRLLRSELRGHCARKASHNHKPNSVLVKTYLIPHLHFIGAR